MFEEEDSWRWPVDWTRATAGPTLFDASALVAHRLLDRFSARARDVQRGVPGAAEAFAGTIRDLLRAAPWLREDVERADEHVTAEVTMLDEAGLGVLLAVATRVAGGDGARAVWALAVTAMAAERLLPALTVLDQADIALLAGAVTTHADRDTLVEVPVWERLYELARQDPRAAMPSRCLRLIEDLVTEPQVPTPSGPVVWTTGNDRVVAEEPPRTRLS
jgi:hypothetical protein